MSNAKSEPTMEGLYVRPYRPTDQSCVSHLYTAGLLDGQISPNDTGADIENIRAAYFDDERHGFWIADMQGVVVGMIGVGSDEEHTAEIRRLRVLPGYQRTPIAATLLEAALSHCKRHGYLKIRLDTRFEKSAAVDLFDRLGFQHTRTMNVHERDLLEFYLDLYRPPREEEDRPEPARLCQ